jgi:hypothetical protein
MCCGPESYHGVRHWAHHHSGFWACGWPFRFGPCSRTKKEEAAWLEQYLEGLREEAKAVEERIAELKGEE